MTMTPKTMNCWRDGKWHADELANLAAKLERDAEDGCGLSEMDKWSFAPTLELAICKFAKAVFTEQPT